MKIFTPMREQATEMLKHFTERSISMKSYYDKWCIVANKYGVRKGILYIIALESICNRIPALQQAINIDYENYLTGWRHL